MAVKEFAVRFAQQGMAPVVDQRGGVDRRTDFAGDVEDVAEADGGEVGFLQRHRFAPDFFIAGDQIVKGLADRGVLESLVVRRFLAGFGDIGEGGEGLFLEPVPGGAVGGIFQTGADGREFGRGDPQPGMGFGRNHRGLVSGRFRRHCRRCVGGDFEVAEPEAGGKFDGELLLAAGEIEFAEHAAERRLIDPRRIGDAPGRDRAVERQSQHQRLEFARSLAHQLPPGVVERGAADQIVPPRFGGANGKRDVVFVRFAVVAGLEGDHSAGKVGVVGEQRGRRVDFARSGVKPDHRRGADFGRIGKGPVGGFKQVVADQDRPLRLPLRIDKDQQFFRFLGSPAADFDAPVSAAAGREPGLEILAGGEEGELKIEDRGIFFDRALGELDFDGGAVVFAGFGGVAFGDPDFALVAVVGERKDFAAAVVDRAAEAAELIRRGVVRKGRGKRHFAAFGSQGIAVDHRRGGVERAAQREEQKSLHGGFHRVQSGR